MKGINFSIIIPHYNVPELLLRCLRSIPHRDDIEIIVVDDCSLDFDRFRGQVAAIFPDYNIKFYSTEKNSGPGIARNIGLDHASGKWIIFEDADDFFSDEINVIIESCVNRIEDILFFHNKSVMSDDPDIPANDYLYEDIIERYIETGNDTDLRYKYHSAWGRLISRSFIEKFNLRFDGRFYGEDLLFAVKIGHLCNSIAVLPHYLDVVTSRPGSLSHSWEDWGEWYRQFFPAHIEAMRYLHRNEIKAFDASVYGKLYTLLTLDVKTFKFFWGKFSLKEQVKGMFYLVKGVACTVLRK